MTRRRRGARPGIRRWYEKFERLLDAIDRRDGFDSQIPTWKFIQVREDRYDHVRDDEVEARDQGLYFQPPPPELLEASKKNPHNFAEFRDGELQARERNPELLATLPALIRNALSDIARRALEMRYQDQDIGGGRVLRMFTIRGEVMLPGRYLAADEILNIAPLTRGALQEAGCLEVFPQGSPAWWPKNAPKVPAKYRGQASYSAIAKALGLRDASHARKVVRGAEQKLRKRLKKL